MEKTKKLTITESKNKNSDSNSLHRIRKINNQLYIIPRHAKGQSRLETLISKEWGRRRD